MPPELIALVTSGGAVIAPIFVYLWWEERKDNRELRAKNEVLAERTIVAMADFKNLLQTVVDIFNGRKI